jgi:K+-sensing histidine kinase KdpD
VLGVLADELRTPLTTIRIGLFLLDARRIPPAQRRELISEVRAETERLVRAVDDLVAIARPADDRHREEPVLLQRLIPPLVASTSGEGTSPVVLSLDEGSPPARADADAVRQIVVDLLSIVSGPTTSRVPVKIQLKGDRDRVRIAISGPATGSPIGADGSSGALALAAARSTARSLGGRLTARRRGRKTIELGLDLPAEPDEA